MKERINELVPHIQPSCYIHNSAVIIGSVTLGENVSVWPCATLRGDIASITVGDNSNIQENACLHVNYGSPVIIGKGDGTGLSDAKINCYLGFLGIVDGYFGEYGGAFIQEELVFSILNALFISNLISYVFFIILVKIDSLYSTKSTSF